MKRLVALLMCAVSLGAAAQFPNLPYNPDENSDGLIGVVDLQGLLSSYGNEFSSAVVPDDSSYAIVNLGEMRYLPCVHACKSLPGAWSIFGAAEAGFLISMTELNGPSWIDFDTNGNEQASLVFDNGAIQGMLNIGSGESHNCQCSVKQRPKIEYSFCQGEAPDDALLNQCISGKLADGWYPLVGFPNHRDRQPAGGVNNNGYYNQINFQPYTHASFWRWAE